MSFPIDTIRAQFPALANNPDLIFFDNPGGTQVPQSVIDAVSGYWATSCANVGGAFATSQRTDATVAAARAAMARLLGTPDPYEIVFGQSMTALTFHLARSFGETLSPGDEIIVTDLDHDANVAPWRELEAVGAVIRRVPFDPATGLLDMTALEAALTPGKTRLLAITAASNALGTIPDLAHAIGLAHAAGALVSVDAVQFVPHCPTDVRALNCDFLACSAYKFFGPHIGVLYGKREHLERLKPHKVRPAKTSIPHCWEQGTLNHECLAGVTAAVEYIESVGMDAMQRYEAELGTRLLEGLHRLPGVTVYGPGKSDRVPTVAFTVAGHTPRAVAEVLGAAGICTWSGNYYAVGVMETLSLPEGAVRVGLAHYNTVPEVERLLSILATLESK
ncbi:cysteine desulfurase-like protein [Armatimonas rosea]|uniref:Cysteine desulfurase family protein (TIGR01976 family) n=1 Tax=Armatimonas rosea TaxID=685828 RepID=A0A7W9SRP3_ARMRO|nr:cysteine desulfurase-like protein [Armatimonas rosea]MBB6051597.1 cysteine desulfurase family protein (TIGR01976 family) [Armatimonas rosea]